MLLIGSCGHEAERTVRVRGYFKRMFVYSHIIYVLCFMRVYNYTCYTPAVGRRGREIGTLVKLNHKLIYLLCLWLLVFNIYSQFTCTYSYPQISYALIFTSVLSIASVGQTPGCHILFFSLIKYSRLFSKVLNLFSYFRLTRNSNGLIRPPEFRRFNTPPNKCFPPKIYIFEALDLEMLLQY